MLDELNDLLDDELDEQAAISKPESESEPRKPKLRRLSSQDMQTQPATQEETSEESPVEGFNAWQTVLWREWARCQDEDYAFYLFNLVQTTTFGQRFVIILAIVGLLVGGFLGYIFGVAFSTTNLVFANVDLSLLPPILLTWTMGLAGGVIGLEGSRRYRTWYFWWKGQPPTSRVIWALQQAIIHDPEAKTVWAEPLHLLTQTMEKPPHASILIKQLGSDSWIERFAARHVLVQLGSEIAAELQPIAADDKQPLWEMALWLLSSIERATSHNFAWRANHTQCPYCQTLFTANAIDVSLGVSFNCYGCRTCQQSRNFLYVPQGVVAVLDSNWESAELLQNGLLQLNWLTRRTLFDFDWVEIVQATDEDVERFAVQVGNDTDLLRQPRYATMHCALGPECNLSQNTLRILRRTFGTVSKVTGSQSSRVAEPQSNKVLKTPHNSLCKLF